MDPTTILGVIEKACRDLQDPFLQAIAEKTLHDFRCTAQPYEACKYILENSADSLAQFHAVAAIRDAALREWDSVLSSDYRSSIVEYLLYKCLENEETRAALVTRQLGACTGTLLKRIWGDLDKTGRESILNRIASISLQEHSSISTKSRAVELMQAVVIEFNPYTASQIGLPLEYHYECKQDLELNFLPQILQWAVSCARSSCQQACLGLDAGLCSSSVSLISALLLWDSSKYENQGNIDINIQVRPPESWREILFGPPGADWPLKFLNDISSCIRTGSMKDSELTAAYLQILNNLASLHGKILQSENGRKALSLNTESSCSVTGHLRNILGLLLPDLRALEAIFTHPSSLDWLNETGDVILGVCRAIASVVATNPLKELIYAMTMGNFGHQEAENILGTLTNCTINLLSFAKGGNEVAEECAEMMLETWVELSVDCDLQSHLGNLYDIFCSCQGSIFQAFLDKKICEACVEVYSDEEDFEGGEEAYSDSDLSGLASIGRCSHRISFPYLIEAFERSKTNLQMVLSNESDSSVPLEEICWLLRISSFVIADTGEGETPLVPQIYIEDFRNDVNKNLVLCLSKTILGLAMDFRSSIGTSIASSRLMEELCKALGRWSETYLLPELKGVDRQIDWNGYLFTSTEEGTSVINLLVELVQICFERFPGDRTLHLCACQSLLKPLPKYESIRPVLSQTSSWKNLVQSYLQELDFIKVLEAEVQLHLTASICTGIDSQEYLSEIISWQVHKVSVHSSSPEYEFSVPENVTRVLNALSSIRGAVRSNHDKSHTIIFHEVRKVFPFCLTILDLSKNLVGIYNNVLDLAADIVEYHGPFLSDEESKSLFSWTIEIIRKHASNKILLTVKKELLLSTEFDDECDALLSLLRLLTQVTNAETCHHEDIAATIFLGVESVMPLLTVEHLKVPPVRHSFFTLLGYMVEVYASKVAQLSPKSFASFMEAIAFGVKIQDDSETGSAVFEAIAAFAKYSITSRYNGVDGIGENENTMINGNPPLIFLYDAIMSRVIFDDGRLNAIDFASEPVLYLMAHEPSSYTQFLQSKIFHQPIQNELLYQKILGALEELHSGVLNNLSLDIPSRHSFRRAFKNSVLVMRSVMRKR